MKLWIRPLALLLSGLALACHTTPTEAPEASSSEVVQARPEVRYYVIADT